MTLVGFAASAEVVYDNTVNDLTGRFATGSAEVGDQIILGGSLRVLETFSFEFYYTNTASILGSPQVTLNLYANDGPEFNGYASPGSVLYASPTYGGLITTFTNRATIEFDQSDFGDSVVLPDSFTWTVQFSGLDANDDIGLDIYSPPVVGDNYADYWINTGSGWELKQADVDPANNPIDFAAYVTAVPEPATFALLLLGGLGCTVWRRRS